MEMKKSIDVLLRRYSRMVPPISKLTIETDLLHLKSQIPEPSAEDTIKQVHNLLNNIDVSNWESNVNEVLGVLSNYLNEANS